jgi:hypothetical protein
MFFKAFCCSAALFLALGLLGIRIRRARGR